MREMQLSGIAARILVSRSVDVVEQESAFRHRERGQMASGSESPSPPGTLIQKDTNMCRVVVSNCSDHSMIQDVRPSQIVRCRRRRQDNNMFVDVTSRAQLL
jgi:hypothetical protein